MAVLEQSAAARLDGSGLCTHTADGFEKTKNPANPVYTGNIEGGVIKYTKRVTGVPVGTALEQSPRRALSRHSWTHPAEPDAFHLSRRVQFPFHYPG